MASSEKSVQRQAVMSDNSFFMTTTFPIKSQSHREHRTSQLQIAVGNAA